MAVPPGGLYFFDLQTPSGSVHFEAGHMHLLVDKIRRFCDVNSLPFPRDPEKTIQAFMCPRLPDGFCFSKGLAPNAHTFSLQSVKDMTRLIVQKAFRSRHPFLAPQSEAETRATICLTCPHNSSKECTVCSGLLQMVRQLVGRRETKYDPYLGTCGLCGCLLRVKVHISAGALKAATTPPPDSEIPAACWLRGVYQTASKPEERHE